jgi:hypothetical protein
MKIVVIGGTGLIGTKTVAILRQRNHEVLAASPKSGINTITGERLKEAVTNAEVVIDLANSPSFENQAVMEFFRETSGRNLLPVEAATGVRHHVALSMSEPTEPPTTVIFAPRSPRKKWSRLPASPIPSFALPSSWNSSLASPLQVQSETWSDFRPTCSSRSRQRTLLLSSPMWRSRRRETASSRSPARNGNRSMSHRPLSEGGRRSAAGRE